MTIPVYVIDTSYLCELFAVPRYSTKEAISEVRRRFTVATKIGARVYVSLPTIFELAGHIADVPEGRERRRLSEKLRDTVFTSIREGYPWSLLPAISEDAVKGLLERFVRYSPEKGISLVDTILIDEANHLRKTKYRGKEWQVHIWTKDERLKAEEPDAESNAFLG